MTLDSCPAGGWVGRAADAYHRGRPLALLFDFDGTLTPIVRHPSLAFLPPSTRRRLERLTALPDVAAGVLSGRALDEVKSRVGFPHFFYAGSGGLEMDLLGERRAFPGGVAFEGVLDVVHERLVELLARFPGTWVERKPAAMSVHLRGLLPLSAVSVRWEVSSLLADLPNVRLRVVTEAIELTPADGWDKGTAVRAVLARLGGDPLPVYFGDSVNDIEGMAVTAAAGGPTVGIGPDAPAGAEYHLPTPERLAAELAVLHQALAAARGLNVPRDDEPSAPVEDVTRPLVVVVEPDTDHRGRVSESLRRCGWRVWAFARPDEANGALADHPDEVRAVLVDLEQPGLSGGRLLAEVGRARPAVVRCGMARVPCHLASVFRRMSGIPVLTKPLDPAESDRQLRALLTDGG